MLYIQSRADMTLGVIEEFYNDTHQMILSSGVSSYTFTVAKNIEDSQYLVEGNYVIITDDQGLGWKFTIMNTTQTHTEITVYCEDIGLELVNKVMDAWNAPTTKQPASYYINKAIKDTKWKIGFNQISNLSRTLKWDGRDTSLNRLLSICTEFDHAEIEFRVKFHNLQVTDYIINIYKSRGANRSDIQLVYGETVDDITKSSSIEELATAMMGVGSDKELPENAPQGAIPDKVTFKNLTYDDGFFFTKMGDPFLRARVANQQFNLREGYIEDYYEYDTSDPQELLNRTITQLKERSEIKVNYEVSAVKFDKSLQLGDTITIIDHDYKPELLLSGRVLELDKSYTDASQDKLVLGNFLILYSNINDKLYNLQNQIKNMKVDNNYMWLRYAIDDKGTGMSATPTAGTKYFAMLVNKKTGVPSDNPADYAGHWKLIQGEDGKDGVAGEKGADGKTSYTHFAYANDVSGHSDFSLDDPTGRAYMGVFSDFTKADSTNPDDYIWSLTKGEDGEQGIQGLQGPQGTKGIAGPKGEDGKTQYTHIAYSNSADGKIDFSQTPANHKYIGMYVDFIEDDSNDPTKYGWSLIKGEDGLDGPQGIAGPKGADGKTSYTHIAYANGGETQMNMSKWTLSEPAKQAGAITYKEGTNYIQYSGVSNWENYNMQFIAKKGDSISVTVTWTQPAISGHFSFYGATTPQMGVPTGEVGNTGSTALKNKVFKFTFTAGGDNPYFVISGGNVADGVLYPLEVSVQQDFSQSPNDHTYIGMYTDFTEADSDDVSLYNWTQIKGSDGTQGVAGKAGADGKTPYFHSAWANSADGKTGFSTTDSVNKSYLGTYTDFTQADSTDPTKYAWSLIKGKDGTNGTPGKAGADGKTPYFHTAWADSKDGKINFSLTDATNRGFLGTYTDFVQADSTDPAKYTWTELVGGLNLSARNLASRKLFRPFGDSTVKGGSDTVLVTGTASNTVAGMGVRRHHLVKPNTTYIFTFDFQILTGKINHIAGHVGDFKSTNYVKVNGKNWGANWNGTYPFTPMAGESHHFEISLTTEDTLPSDGTDGFWIQPNRNGTAAAYSAQVSNLRINEGSKDLGYSKPIEDIDDSLNSLQTPNLVYNAGFNGDYKGGLDGWTAGGGGTWATSAALRTSNEGSRSAVFDVNTTPATTTYYALHSKRFPVNKDLAYSFSGDASIHNESNHPFPYLEVNWFDASNKGVGNTSSMWDVNIKEKFQHTYLENVKPPATATQAQLSFIIRTNANVATHHLVSFSRPMMNIGEYVAQYTDRGASEADVSKVNDALNQANAKINAVPHVSAQSSAPTNPKQGDQWWVLDESGKATGFKVWSGTDWADSKIQQSLLNVVSLNAVTITGSTINGSKFTNNFDFTNADKIRFQGVTTIGDGAINITWKIPANNQTGQTLLNASGFQSVVNDSDGAIINRTDLLFGELDLKNRTSGTGATSKYVWGSLTAQDVYRGDTTAVQWLSGWGDWGNGNGLIHVTRNGYTVSVSGYPHHNNSENFAEVATLPAWARPPKTVNLSGTIYDSGVMNPAACKITIDQNGKVQVTNGKKGGYLIIGGTYVGQDIV